MAWSCVTCIYKIDLLEDTKRVVLELIKIRVVYVVDFPIQITSPFETGN